MTLYTGHKPYTINMHKPQMGLRSKRIKGKFIESGIFRDSGQFDCGDHIAYVMEEDFRAMKFAIRLLRDAMSDFLNDDDVQVEPMEGRDKLILNAITALRDRINVPDMDDLNRYESTKNSPT